MSRGIKITYISSTLIVLSTLLLGGCTAWPGLTGILGLLGKSKSSAIFFLPPKPSSQPQDNPTLSDDPNTILDPITNEVPITPNPPDPEVIVNSRTGNVVSETGTYVDVTIVLSAQPNANVRIYDFILSHSGEVSLSHSEFIFTPSNWNVPQTLRITGLPDYIQDGDKEVTIQLGFTESLDSRFNNLNAGTIQVLNVDIDSAGVALYPLSGIVTTESGGTYNLTAVLNSKPTANVSFPVVVSHPSEVSASITTVVFTPTNWNTPQTITLTGLDDSIMDGNVNYTVQLGPATSTDPIYDGMVSSLANGVNLDDDTAGISVTTTATMPYTISEDGTSITFKVRLTSQPTASVQIPILSLNPAEGQPNVSSLIFTAANWNIEQNLVVTGIDDPDIDGDKLFTVRLDTPISSDSNYSVLPPYNISITNLDNDYAALVFQNHIGLTTGEDGTKATFQIRLRSRPTANVVVSIQSSNTSEGTVSPTSITFTPTNWNTWRTITVTGVNDSLIDGDIWYEIQFPSVTSSDVHYHNLIVPPLPVVNLDDDMPGVVFIDASPSVPIVTNENQTSPRVFQIRLKTRPTDTVQFPSITSSNTNEGTVSPATLVFTPSNWNVPQSVSIQPIRDYIADGNVTYTIDFANLVSSDPLYSNFVVPSLTVINNNVDTRGYVFNRTFNSTNNLIVTDSGLKDQFTLRLNSKPTNDVIIPLSVLDTNRLAVSPTSLTFTPTNWNIPQTVEVEGLFFAQVNPPVSTIIGLRLGTFNTSDNRFYPSGTSDYSTQSINDFNSGGSTDNGNINVVRYNTQRPVTIIHRANTATTIQTTTEAGVSVPLWIKLGWEPTDPVTVNIHTSRPDEGLPVPSSVTILPHEWDQMHLVNIVGQSDDIIDGHQNYTISFTVTSLDSNFHNFSVPNMSFRNNDINSNAIIRSPNNSTTAPYITTRTPGPNHTYTFTIRLNGRPNGTVTVPIVSNNTSEGTVSPTSLTFNASNWNIPQNVTIQAVNSPSTAIVNYTITVGPTSSNPTLDPQFNVGTNAVTIHVRNTAPGFDITGPSGKTGEWGRRASFGFRLTSPPTDTVTCYYYIDNENEGKGISGTIDTSFSIPNIVRRFTRTPSNWNTYVTIQVEGVDDNIIDGDQEFRVHFLPCTSTDPNYNALQPTNVITFINEDND